MLFIVSTQVKIISTEMAEKYREPKNKSSRGFKRNESLSSTLIKSRNKHTHKLKEEPQTPPLPSKNHSSMHELLKRREALKKQLEKIEKHPDDSSNIRNYNRGDKKRKYSYDNTDKIHYRKSSNFHKDNKKHNVKDLSPENDYTQLDSEDEESIIEERRKKRKHLMEQLNISDNAKNVTSENPTTEYNSITLNSDNIKHDNEIPIECAANKEMTDMFSEKDDFLSVSDQVTQDNNDEVHLTDNWDDLDGYYNIKVGDIINNNRYIIKSILGKGVFANVVRAQDNNQKNQANMNVAIKIIRNNDLMYQTGLKEIATLKEINSADPENKYHCVKMLDYFMHKGHLCLVLEALYMDLRCVLKKYGKQNGINMKALMCYSRQLFLALRLLKKIGVIHADIKPDNILINENKNILKLCDFGSAAKVDDNEPTPYLVSRFYRAPEIILGVTYNYSVDTWSTACTIYELATGKIMFTGSSNNKMLKCFMDLKGKIPGKLIRKGRFKDQHFNYKNNFLLHTKDTVTGREKNVEMTNITIIRDLEKDLKKSCLNMSSKEDKKIMQLKDLLDKMLMLDPKQRLSNIDCLKHPFISEELHI